MSSKEKGRSNVRTKRLGVAELAGSRLLPHLVPWGITGSAMPAALLANWQLSDDPVMTVLTGAGAVVLTGYTHLTWSRRHEHTRALATTFCGAVTGWFALASATGPLDHMMAVTWGYGSVVLSLAWNIRHASMSPHHEEDKAQGHRDPLFQRVSALAGARTKKVKESPTRVEAKVQLKPGEGTASDVQNDKDRIASAVGMDPNEVSVTAVPGRADQVLLAFEPKESSARTLHWTGPSLAGASIADGALVFGGRSDGSYMAIWVVGDDDAENPRALPHTLVTGVPGAGKTEAVKTVIIDGRSRRDFCAVVGDPEKFQQSFGEIADTLSFAAVDKAQTQQLIRNLPDAIRYRAQLLGTLPRSDGTIGYPQWEPECWTLHRIPLCLVDIEEAASVLGSGDDEFDQAIRTARSVGLPIVASMQTAHNQNIDRKTRGMFTNALAFGCMEDYDARFTLSKATLEAGADPTKWGADAPGKLYAETLGTPRDKWPVEGRAFKLSRAQKRAELDASRAQWAELDQGTYLCLSRGIKAVPADRPVSGDTAQEQEPEELTAVDLTAVPTEEGTTDVTAGLPEPQHSEPFPLRDPAMARMSTEDARQALSDRVDKLDAAGETGLGFSDLADLTTVTGRTRGWVYGELNRLVDEGRLTRHDGKPPYRIQSRMANGQHTG